MSTGEARPRLEGTLTQMPSAGSGMRRFPALDPEPPPQPIRRRVLWGLGAALAVALVILAVAVTRSGSTSGREGPAVTVPLPGRILVLRADATLALTTPGGDLVRALPQAGAFEQQIPTASAEGRLLLLPSGEVLAVGPSGLSRTGWSVAAEMGPNSYTEAAAAFADGERDVVVRDGNAYRGNQPAEGVRLVSLAGGRPADLGLADGAAGDPAGAGAFVTVASSAPAVSAEPVLAQPDASVELREAGGNPVELAAAGQLLAAVGDPQSQLSRLGLYPSPDGSHLAVSVTDDVLSPRPSGLVVLDRTGHITAAVPAGLGPTGFTSPAWSPDGKNLAFVTGGGPRPQVTIWSPGGSTLSEDLPVPAGTAGDCVWAPNGGGVLCSTFAGASTAPGAPGFRTYWSVVLRSGDVIPVRGAGYPLAWTPSGAHGAPGPAATAGGSAR